MAVDAIIIVIKANYNMKRNIERRERRTIREKTTLFQPCKPYDTVRDAFCRDDDQDGICERDRVYERMEWFDGRVAHDYCGGGWIWRIDIITRVHHSYVSARNAWELAPDYQKKNHERYLDFWNHNSITRCDWTYFFAIIQYSLFWLKNVLRYKV